MEAKRERRITWLSRINPAWLIFLGVVLICCSFLIYWPSSESSATVLKINQESVVAQIAHVSENGDGSVNVMLKLNQKVPQSMRQLINSHVSNESRAITTRRVQGPLRVVYTKTEYPLTLDSPYVINNPDICTDHKEITFLIIVHSAPGHFQRRRTLRETWANRHIFKTLQMRIVFLFGLSTDRKTQVLIENESTVYKDIVQGDFIDAYKNLTHKGVLGYRWISQHCNSSKLIIKVDDDVFVNIFAILDRILPTYAKKPKRILCHVRKDGTSPILHGITKLKWSVDEDEFRRQKYYPTYCNGYAVFMTPDIITGLYRAAYLTPFFWVDDVYLFGLLPKKIGGVVWENIVKNFTLNQKAGLESYETKAESKYLVCAAWQDGVMERLWFAALSQLSPHHRELINDDFRLALDNMVIEMQAKQALQKQKAKELQAQKANENKDAKPAEAPKVKKS